MNRITIFITLLGLATLGACTPPSGGSCPDCHDSLASGIQPKKIIISQGSVTTAVLRFTYKRNLIDSIFKIIPVGTDSIRYQYGLLYSNCLLSGYSYMQVDTLPDRRNFVGDAGFITDTNKINQKIEARFQVIPFNTESLHAKYDYFRYPTGVMQERRKRCLGGCLQIGTHNTSIFDPQGNVDTFTTRTDEWEYSCFTHSWDTKANPLHLQNGVLYFLNLEPLSYAVPRSSLGTGFNDLFDFWELSNHNPLLVTKRTPTGSDNQYSFNYTYDSQGQPLTITVLAANPISATGFGPPAVVGKLQLEY